MFLTPYESTLDAGYVPCSCNNDNFGAVCRVVYYALYAGNSLPYSTVCSYDRNGVDIESDVDWFKTLPLVYDTPEIIFCHAGLSKPLLKDNTAHDLIWGRDWIRHNDRRPREKQVIFGHTPSRTGAAYTVATGDICIDSACVYGGKLCALAISEDGNSKLFYADKSEKDDENLQGIS